MEQAMDITLHQFTDADLRSLTRLFNHWSEDSSFTEDQVRESARVVRTKSDTEILLARNESEEAVGYVQLGPLYFFGFKPAYEIMQ